MKTAFIPKFFPNSLFFIFFLFLLFFLSGCLSQEEQFKNKTLCLELTSYSFQKIPECSTQEECFNKVEKELFNFPADSFSGSSALALNSYKNNLASSWLYSNKALAKTKEINQLCTQNNFSSLPEKTNELGFFLQKSFEFTDKTSIDSFSFILLEKNFLEEQEIELIPEEQLFDDFILFNQNLNELSTPDVYKESNSYVSNYFSVSREFNEFSSKIGFYSLYLNEFSSTDLAGYYSKDGLNLVKSKQFYVPLLKKTFSSLLSFVSSSNDLQESIQILKKMPSNELFELFGKFSSPENSVASNFSELVSNTALHKQQLKQKNNELSSAIESNLNQISSKLNSLSLSPLNKFDSNVLGFLFENLESSSVSQKENSIYSVDSFVVTSKEKLFFLKAEFSELRKKEYFNEISLGETSSSLKEINSNLFSLNEDLDFYSNELFSELIILCDSKTELIKKELDSVDFSAKPWQAVSLGSKIAVKISDYKFLEKEEKLFYCKEIISLNNDFSLALINYEKFFLQSEQSLNSCFDSLEKIFYSRSLPDFIDLFYSLKSIKEKMPASYVLASCSELKENALNSLYSEDKELNEISFLYSDSRKLFSKLVFLSKLYPVFFSSSKIQLFKENLDEFSLKFSGENFSPEFFSETKETLFSLKEFNEEIHLFFVSSFQEFLSANFTSKAIPLEQAVLGKTFLVRQKIFFPNPLNELLAEDFSVVLPKISGKQVFSDSCIKETAQEKDNLRLLFSCLPENGLFLEFDFNFSIPFSHSFKIVEITQNKALFRKSIEFSSFSVVSNIKAEIPLEFNPDYAFVLADSEKIPVSVEGKKAVFYLVDLNPDSKIELFYSVPDPVSVVFSEESKTKTDENTFFIELNVKAKNNLAFAFGSIKIFVPLNDFDSIQGIKLFDSFSEISFEKIDGKIVFSVSLNELQQKEFTLKFTVKDFAEYSLKLKNSIISDLVFLSNSDNKEISSYSIQLKNKANSALNVDELIELRQETDFLLLNENNSIETEFNAVKNSVQEKIDLLQKNISFFDSIGFTSDSRELQLKLNKAESDLISFLSLSKDKALQEMLLLNSSLEDFSEENTEEFLLNKRDDLMNKTKKLSSQISLLEDQNLSITLSEILAQDNNFFSLFSKKDYFNAGFSLKAIEEKTFFLEEALNQKIRSKKEFLNSGISFLETQKNSVNSLFSQLASALSSSDSYLAPITQKRLVFLKDSIEKINFSFDSNLNSLESLISAEKKLNEQKLKLTKIEEELSFSLNKIKEDAKVFLLSAKLSKADVSLAEKLFSEGKFIDSINESLKLQQNSSTGFISLSSFELPIQVYPLFGVILFLLYRKLKGNKKKKRKTKTKISSFSV